MLLHLFHSAVNARLEVLFGPVISALLTSWRLGFESFFVMAGFFLAHSFRETSSNYLSVPKFAQRRFTRLAVPFWCAVLLAYLDVALPNLLLGHHNALPSARSVIAEMLFMSNLNGSGNLSLTFWSMSVVIQIYVLWIAAFWIIRRVFLAKGEPDFHRATERVMSILTMATAITAAVVFVKVGLRRTG